MSAKNSPKVGQKKGSFNRATPKRQPKPSEWFAENGFHQVPPTEYIGFKILYAHESDLRFVGRFGTEQVPNFNPAKQDPNKHHGHGEPSMRHFCCRKCHILRALAFYGPRPTFITKKGTVRPCECHHLNADLEDHRKDNLLAWLSGPVHRIADKRQDRLQELVPNGDLLGFDYDILRELQDPRTMSDEDFQSRLAYIRHMHDCNFDPRIFNAKEFHHWFSMDFEQFKSFFEHYKND